MIVELSRCPSGGVEGIHKGTRVPEVCGFRKNFTIGEGWVIKLFFSQTLIIIIFCYLYKST
jgi:hypothetical protein